MGACDWISGLLGSCLRVGTAATRPEERPVKFLGNRIFSRPNYPALEVPAASKFAKLHCCSLWWPWVLVCSSPGSN